MVGREDVASERSLKEEEVVHEDEACARTNACRRWQKRKGSRAEGNCGKHGQGHHKTYSRQNLEEKKQVGSVAWFAPLVGT